MFTGIIIGEEGEMGTVDKENANQYNKSVDTIHKFIE